MKKQWRVGGLLLAGLGLAWWGCAGDHPYSPTANPTPTPTTVPLTATPTATPSISSTRTSTPTASASPTPTASATSTSAIDWGQASVSRVTSSGITSLSAQLYLAVNGQPVSSATVVLGGTGVSGPVTLPPAPGSLVTLGGKAYQDYHQNTGWTYQPGQTYSLTSVTSAGTASATLAAPGPITIATDGLQAGWGTDTNDNFVSVQSAVTTTFSACCAGIHSPFAIPVTAYPAPGLYTVQVQMLDITNTISGATASSQYSVGDVLYQGVTIPTPTPTSTATSTPTPTATSTFTATSTATPAVYWYQAYLQRYQYGGNPIGQTAFLGLQVNGAPLATANVVLTGSNIPTPVTFTYGGNASQGSVTYAGYGANSGWTYQQGQTYTLTTIAMGVTATATLQAPGPLTLLADGTGAVTEATWTVDGNNDSILAIENGTTSTYSVGDVDAPYPIPVATAYPNSGGVTYEVQVHNENATTGSIAHTVPGSLFWIEDFRDTTFVK